MGMRMPPQGGEQPQGQGGGAAELAANVSNGLEAIAQMVAGQFGEDAGNQIAGLQQQFQQIMLGLTQQGGQQATQAAPGDQAGVAAAQAPSPQLRQ